MVWILLPKEEKESRKLRYYQADHELDNMQNKQMMQKNKSAVEEKN